MDSLQPLLHGPPGNAHGQDGEQPEYVRQRGWHGLYRAGGFDLYEHLSDAVESLYARFSAEPDVEPLEEAEEEQPTDYEDAPEGTGILPLKIFWYRP